MIFSEISGFDKDPTTSKFEIYAKVDKFSLIAKYKVKGNIIILPIVGQGPANLTLGRYKFLFWKHVNSSTFSVFIS